MNFIKSPKIIIGEPQVIVVTPTIQKKMDKISTLLSKTKAQNREGMRCSKLSSRDTVRLIIFNPIIMNKDMAVKITLTLLRVVAAFILFEAGALKLFGWFGGMPAGFQLPTLLYAAGIIEVIGGTALFFGLFSRPVAFILSGEMAFAYFIGHFKMSAFWPIQNHGEIAVLLCFIFLFLAAFGGGELSLDGLMKARRK